MNANTLTAATATAVTVAAAIVERISVILSRRHAQVVDKSAGVSMQSRVFKSVVSLALISGITACQMGGNNATAEKASSKDPRTNGVLFFYSEREPGSELFKSQMFVSKEVLYFTDDVTPNDFLLFDRKKQTIYSVNSSNRTVFVITPKEVNIDSPMKIDYEEESQPSAINGRKATHYKYTANGKHCYDVVTAEKEHFPEVTKALKEYRQVLAGEHATSVHRIPRDLLDACDLAVNVFHAGRHLDNGVPLREWDQRGYQKFMVNFSDDFNIKPEKLTIPEDYKRYSVDNQVPE